MIAKKIDQATWSFSTALARFNKKIIKLINKYNDYMMSDSIYYKARQLTKPLHWLWIWKWLAKIKKTYNTNPFSEPGLYIITAPPGGGKSSLAYEIMERMRRKNGKGSYINTAIEKPHIDYIKNRYYCFHKKYDIKDFFDNNEIKIYPNHYEYNSIHIDEAHRVWNYRNNMTGSYKDSFIPFMDYSVGVRQYIGHIFMYTQLKKVDNQAEGLANGNIYQVRIDKGFDYKKWCEDGNFKLTIKGWYIDKIDITNGKVNVINSWYWNRTFNIDYFDTFNLQKELDVKKLDKTESLERVKK